MENIDIHPNVKLQHRMDMLKYKISRMKDAMEEMEIELKREEKVLLNRQNALTKIENLDPVE